MRRSNLERLSSATGASVVAVDAFFRRCRRFSIRSQTSLIPLFAVLDSTSPAGTTNDNKRLGDGKLASNTGERLSVSRPVVFQRDYEAAMQIWRGMRRVKYAAGWQTGSTAPSPTESPHGEHSRQRNSGLPGEISLPASSSSNLFTGIAPTYVTAENGFAR